MGQSWRTGKCSKPLRRTDFCLLLRFSHGLSVSSFCFHRCSVSTYHDSNQGVCFVSVPYALLQVLSCSALSACHMLRSIGPQMLFSCVQRSVPGFCASDMSSASLPDSFTDAERLLSLLCFVTF